MNILLTGGAGYIGSHTYVELCAAGHHAVIVDNFYNSSAAVLKRLESITGSPVPFFEADVCDPQAMDKIFAAYAFDAVVHFAGYKAVGESVAKPLAYYRNNLDSALTLCEQMKKHGVKRIVFSSSATVYAPGDEPPFAEDMPLGCVNPYAWTKFMSERILTDAAIANPDWSVALLRYFNPIGAHASGTIGEDPVGIPNNLMPFITQVASGVREQLRVFGTDYPTPDGTCIRDYIHVVDLAKGHVAACDYLMEHTGTEAINLGTGIGYSVLDVIRTFETATGIPIPYVTTDRRPGDLPVSFADASKAKRLLGWVAEKSLEDMCRDSWTWQSKNPRGYK
ncbi:MAG TPA: UDP-glucose 4-epimerase GalE [Candidatus Limiplasma sp.]|nr:UDP-glucose 4-epimerase GalE [Candidatus Limiplasma sp.]HRX08555.1 UDP-glucose 4-epimerase GalE [Candidatus Limiplasma sp.]